MFENVEGFENREYYLEEIRELTDKEKELINDFEEKYNLNQENLTIHQLEVLVYHNSDYNEDQKQVLSAVINSDISDKLFNAISNPAYSEETMLALSNGYLYGPNAQMEQQILDLVNSTTPLELNDVNWNFIKVNDPNVINLVVPEVFKEVVDEYLLTFCDENGIEWDLYLEEEQLVLKYSIYELDLRNDDICFVAGIKNMYEELDKKYENEYNDIIFGKKDDSEIHKEAEHYSNMENGYPKEMTLEKTYSTKMKIVCDVLNCSSEDLGETVKANICGAAKAEVATKWSQSITMYNESVQTQENSIVLKKEV